MTSVFLNYVSLVKRLYDQTMQPVCDEYGITRMELDILLFLSNNPEYDTATDITKRRHLTKSHVSSSIKSLEEHLLLKRSRREGNEKTIHLNVSPSAAEILKSGRTAQKIFFDAILLDISEEEKAAMEENLRKLTENAQKALSGGTKHHAI